MAARTTTTKPRTSTGPHPEPPQEAPNNGALVPSDTADREAAKDASRTAGANYLEEVFSGHRAQEIAGALSNSMPMEAFKASVASAVMNNPDLLGCKPGLLFREVIRIARLGLVFDQQLGEAYLIAAYNGKTKKKDTPQARVGYRGLMKLARNESGVLIYAHEVRASDDFECVLGLERKLIHKPKVFVVDRGDVIGFYAVAKFKEGEPDFEPMSQAEINAIRDRTEAYKAFKNGFIKSTPWDTDPVEMGKKTVIRRLCKRLPMGPKMVEAIKIEDHAEGIIKHEEREAPPAGDNGKARLDNFAGGGAKRGAVTDVPSDEGLPLTGGGTKDAATKSAEKLGDILDSLPGESVHPKEEIVANHERDVRENGGGTYGSQRDDGDGGAYVEEEEKPSLEGADHPGNDAGDGEEEPQDDKRVALLALAPAMPEDAAKDWAAGQWMKGWKWINEAMRNIGDVEVRQFLAEEHAPMLRAVIAKSPGYKDAVGKFLAAQGVKIEE